MGQCETEWLIQSIIDFVRWGFEKQKMTEPRFEPAAFFLFVPEPPHPIHIKSFVHDWWLMTVPHVRSIEPAWASVEFRIGRCVLLVGMQHLRNQQNNEMICYCGATYIVIVPIPVSSCLSWCRTIPGAASVKCEQGLLLLPCLIFSPSSLLTTACC